MVSNGVTVTSFNYTDSALNDITVDGVWTGGVDAYGGGGNLSAGLAVPRDLSREHSVKVKWDVGSKYDLKNNRYSEEAPRLQPREAMVPIGLPYPDRIEYLVLHFFQDGRVEAEFAEQIPERRIPQPEEFSL